MEKYETLHQIGEGTFGEVHKARELETGRLVAMKRIRLRNISQGSMYCVQPTLPGAKFVD